MVGFWRTLYNIIGLDYIGTKEQQIIEKQKRLKYLTLEELKNRDKHPLNIENQFIIKMVKKHVKKKKKN